MTRKELDHKVMTTALVVWKSSNNERIASLIETYGTYSHITIQNTEDGYIAQVYVRVHIRDASFGERVGSEYAGGGNEEEALHNLLKKLESRLPVVGA